MPALNFKKEFAPKVEALIKRMALRKKRADGRDPKPGQLLYFFSGMRTKGCRRLGQAVCKKSTPVQISQAFDVDLGGRRLDAVAVMDLARADGFDSAIDFYNFFSKTHGLPFDGFAIEW